MSAAAAHGDSIIVGALNPVEGKVVPVPTHPAINEKVRLPAEDAANKDGAGDSEIKPATPSNEGDHDGDHEKDDGSEDVIIITGADAAEHLLPLRDDFEPALTFRSIFLATVLSAFQAVMSQIYYVSDL